jgi:sugar phosphate isomerase/epimerase
VSDLVERCKKYQLDCDSDSSAIPLRPMTNSLNSITRRDVLRTGALAAAATLLPAETRADAPAFPAPSAATALPIRLGIASYTFRQFDSAHLIDFMHQLRTPYLNLKDVHLPMTPLDQVGPKAAEYRAAGLTLTAAGTIYFQKDEDADIRSKFEYCKAAGISTLVCMPNKDVLPRLEKFVKEYNFRLAIHNHGPEDKNFPSPYDVLNAVKNLDERIGLCIDLGHAMRAGANVVAAIHDAGPRLYDIHIKDLADSTDKGSQVAVGQGVMPIHDIFQALIQTQYKGIVDLEYEIFPKDPMPGVVESFAYMRGVLAGLGYK